MKYILRPLVFILIMMISGLMEASEQKGKEGDYQIIIMGKVTHAEYGSPIKNYEVFIISDSIESAVMDYFKSVRTDEEGFYYDTVFTSLSDGTMVVYTYDFFNNKYEEDVHFRFFDSSNDNVFIANFEIDLPFQQPTLQALFSFQRDSLNKLLHTFSDETEVDSINSWSWDFGDNNISYEQNPKHKYTYAGVYKVELTVEAQVFEHVEINTISHYIYIPKQIYYHLGGHCFTDKVTTIDHGLAYLYLLDPTQFLLPVDTAKIDTLGYYYFFQVPEGQYCVKAQPSSHSKYYGSWTPTYFGDQVFWEDATFFDHNHENWEYDIYLVEGLGAIDGDGMIAGQVMNGSSMGFANNNLEGVDVYLLDENDDPLLSQYTDEEGNFNFDELGLGTYWMCHEITGMPKTKVKIELSESHQEYTDIIIDLTTGDIILDIPEWVNQLNNNVSMPFPNPASSQLSVAVNADSPTDLIFDVIDLNGRYIVSKSTRINSGSNRINVEVSHLEPGMYILKVNAEGKSVERRFIVNR